MNKELTPLEALERLKNTLLAEGFWQDVLYDVAIIESALNRLEQYETPARKEDVMSVAKRLVALEIIKSKELNVFFIKRYSLEDFNYMCRYEQQLTQEEFDLLKEVFK